MSFQEKFDGTRKSRQGRTQPTGGFCPGGGTMGNQWDGGFQPHGRDRACSPSCQHGSEGTTSLGGTPQCPHWGPRSGSHSMTRRPSRGAVSIGCHSIGTGSRVSNPEKGAAIKKLPLANTAGTPAPE
jgi:hypothetical protein